MTDICSSLINKSLIVLLATTDKLDDKDLQLQKTKVVTKYAVKDGGAFFYTLDVRSLESCDDIATQINSLIFNEAQITSARLQSHSVILDCPDACFVLLYVTPSQAATIEKNKTGVVFSNKMPPQEKTAAKIPMHVFGKLKLRLVSAGNKILQYGGIGALLTLLLGGGKFLYDKHKEYQSSKEPSKNYEIFYDPKAAHLRFDPKSIKIDFFTKYKTKHRSDMEKRLGKRANAVNIVFHKFPNYILTYKEFFLRRRELFDIEDLQAIMDSDYADNFMDVMIRVTVELLFVVHQLKTKHAFFDKDEKTRQLGQVIKMAQRFWSQVKLLFPSLARPDLQQDLARAYGQSPV
jgi:hypothetical protein